MYTQKTQCILNIGVCRIHSFIGGDLIFKGSIISLHSKLLFSIARDSERTHLASGSTILICTALVNLFKKSLKCSLGPFITLVSDLIYFSASEILSLAFKAAVWDKDNMCSL